MRHRRHPRRRTDRAGGRPHAVPLPRDPGPVRARIQPSAWRSICAGLFSPSRIRKFWALMSLLDSVITANSLAGARLDQTIEQADQGRLSGARQAHDDEDLAFTDLEAGIDDAERLPGALEDGVLVDALADERQCPFRLVAEHLVEIPDIRSWRHREWCLVPAGRSEAPRE